MAFSPDSQEVVVVDNWRRADGLDTFRFWSTATGKESRALKMPLKPAGLEIWSALRSSTFSPDGKHFAVGWFGWVLVYELASGKEVYRTERGRENVYAVAFSPDGRTVACDDSTAV